MVDLVFCGVCFDGFLVDEIGDKLIGYYIEKFGGCWYFQFINLQQQVLCQFNFVVDLVVVVEVGIGD